VTKGITVVRDITVTRVIRGFTDIVITMVARVIRAVWIVINHKAITDNRVIYYLRDIRVIRRLSGISGRY
jgi:hypothetical protein